MAEYNMAGLLMRATSFQDRFKGHIILAQDNNAPRYLLTKDGKDLYEELKIVAISHEHKIETILKFKTSNVQIQERGTEDHSFTEPLKQRMIDLKYRYNCSFEFDINTNNDICFSAILPSGYIFEIFVIPATRIVKENAPVAKKDPEAGLEPDETRDEDRMETYTLLETVDDRTPIRAFVVKPPKLDDDELKRVTYFVDYEMQMR